MSSNNAQRSNEAMGDSADSNSVSSKTGDEKQPPMKGSSDTSNETNDPSSTSVTATVSSSRQQTSQAAARQHSEQPVALLPSLPEAAAAAAPAIKRSEKKPRRAGFMEHFVKKLREMLDRESEIDGTIVRWSTDGNSFIIIDHNQFEDHTIPTYFGSSIVFTSFVRKLYRYGFNRMPSRGTGRYEFCSPTFRRLGPRGASSPAAAVAANTAGHNAGGNAGGGTSITNPANTQALLLQALAQTNQLAPNLLPRQTDALAALLYLFQRINQQTTFPNQQSINVNNILQGNVDGLQSLLPWQYQVPTIPQLHTALNNLAGGQWSSAQLMGNSQQQQQQQQSTMSNAIIQALMSLSGVFPAQPTFPNTNKATIPEPNVAVQSLVTMINRLGEEERQRRAQLENAIVASLGRILGQGENKERQRGAIAAPGQMLGSPGRSNNTSSVQNQPGIWPSAGNMNLQADRIADILQAARRGEAGPIQQGTHSHQNSSQGDSDDDDEQQNVGPLSSIRKRKSPDDDEDDQYDADDDSLKDRLRKWKK